VVAAPFVIPAITKIIVAYRPPSAARLNVSFAPKATEMLRCRYMTQCANKRHCGREDGFSL
jgi:hypothetical protein